MYKVYWEVKKTGVCGNGTHAMVYNTAKAWIDDLNKRYPGIKHFIKPE